MSGVMRTLTRKLCVVLKQSLLKVMTETTCMDRNVLKRSHLNTFNKTVFGYLTFVAL